MAEYCVCRQRAGPLVKTYTTDRLRFVRIAGERQARPAEMPAMWSKSEDKLELYLALFGYTGTHYILTFDDEHLPDSFDAVKRCLKAFLRSVRRKWPVLTRYVYAVECGHSGGRWHIHFIADERELPFVAIQVLWHYGWVNPGYVDHPVLHKADGYRALARYICKDGNAGFVPLGKHKWGVARGMRAMIPPPEYTTQHRRPPIPRNAFWVHTKTVEAEVDGKSCGKIYKASWITAKP